MLRSTLVFLLFCLSPPVFGDARLPICYGYGCLVQAEIHYSTAQLGDVRQKMLAAVDAPDERKMLAEVIGQLYRWAGEQSDIRNDRGGNFADGDVVGRMDCVDHSTSTTRLLQFLEKQAYLRWHRVLQPEPRYLLGIFPSHWAAVIEELTENAETGETMRFVVDSWFVDNGEPAVILPLADWKKGAGPDV